MKVKALALIVALVGASASPVLSQTTNAPFGEVAHHVVRVDGSASTTSPQARGCRSS
jgi:hypothetical protein